MSDHLHFILSILRKEYTCSQGVVWLNCLNFYSYHIIGDSTCFFGHLQVDDPITSVRKLFMSPSAKKMKPTRGSS